MNNGQLTIPRYQYTQFPVGYWRIAWLGNVRFVRHEHNCFQPVIDVVLTSMSESNPEYKSVNIAIGQLFNLIPGTQWQDGTLLNDSYQSPIHTLELSTHRAKFIKAGSSMGDECEVPRFWLPFSHYNDHQLHTESWCILVELAEQDVIIPCSEILRFYFASSSNLIKRIVSTYFKPDALWQKYDYDPATGLLKLALAAGISGASAVDIGRIALSEDAYCAVSMVSKQLNISFANREKGYIKMPFPFRGNTRLKVTGRQLLIENDRPRLLVDQITSCSHILPFSRLRYTSYSKTKGEPQQVEPLCQETPASPTAKTQITRSATPTKLTNQEPNSGGKTQTRTWSASIRFTDLLRKEVLRVTPDEVETILIGSAHTASAASTGDGMGRYTGVKKIDLCAGFGLVRFEKQHLDIPVLAWKDYFIFLQQLTQEAWVDTLAFLRLDPRQMESHYVQLPNFVDSDGVVLYASDLENDKVFVSVCHLRYRQDRQVWLIAFCRVNKPINADEYYVVADEQPPNWEQIYNLYQKGEVLNLLGKLTLSSCDRAKDLLSVLLAKGCRQG